MTCFLSPLCVRVAQSALRVTTNASVDLEATPHASGGSEVPDINISKAPAPALQLPRGSQHPAATSTTRAALDAPPSGSSCHGTPPQLRSATSPSPRHHRVEDATPPGHSESPCHSVGGASPTASFDRSTRRSNTHPYFSATMAEFSESFWCAMSHNTRLRAFFFFFFLGGNALRCSHSPTHLHVLICGAPQVLCDGVGSVCVCVLPAGVSPHQIRVSVR